jgi:hypothetical protein
MMCAFNWLDLKCNRLARDKKINPNLLWPAVPDAASNFSPGESRVSAGAIVSSRGNVDNGFTIESLAKPEKTKKASCEAP